MIIDLFIATFAVFIVVFAVKKQIKSYKKNGFAAICSGSCVSCEKNWNYRSDFGNCNIQTADSDMV